MPAWFGRPVESGSPVELPVARAYAEWAPRYPAAPHTALMHAEQGAMLALLPDVAGADVLDAACGTGRYLRVLMARGARRVVGVDVSAEMLAHAATARRARVRGDLRALPVKTAVVDVATCGLALNDVAELAVAIGELARVLRPGGRLVASVLHPRGEALGWTRTFDAAAGRRAMPCHWHAGVAIERACASSGLHVDDVGEPAIDGRGDGGPVALVVAATRAPA